MKIVVNHLIQWDVLIFTKVFGFNGKKFIDKLFFWISRSGDGYLYGLIGIFLIIFNPVFGTDIVFAALAAFSIELPVYKFTKQMVKRIRPFDSIPGIQFLIAPPDHFSFPSGHTAAAFIIAIIIGHFYPLLQIILYFWAVLVGLSRIYLGVHYPSDVMVGALLGSASAIIGLSVVIV